MLQTRSVPLGRFSGIKALNQSMRLTDIRRAARRLGFKKPLKWFYYYGSCLQDFEVDREAPTVYYCIDRFSEPEETELTKQADFVVVTNRQIFREKRLLNARCAHVANGCDVAGFVEPQPLPEDLLAIPTPRVGVVAVSTHQIAYAWLADLAERFPGTSLVLIGPFATGGSGPASADLPHLARLKNASNVFFLGFKDPERVPAYIQGLTVGLIPYKDSEFNRSRDPDKLYQYLAAGKPVVSFPIDSLAEVPPGVFFVTNSDEFARYVTTAQDSTEDGSVAARVAVGASSDYSARLEELRVALQDTVLLPPGTPRHDSMKQRPRA